ncbi:MAG TPA: ATP synthase F1 subunit epsilon [Cyclobacteriaceae bacterium]|jgi:F-type H+-transporting ATPase subunit epsilon
MYLEVITPEQKVFEGEVTITTLPGSDGSFQILNHHASLVSSLGKGTLSFKTKEGDYLEHKIEGGVVEVLNNKVIVLAEKILKDD